MCRKSHVSPHETFICRWIVASTKAASSEPASWFVRSVVGLVHLIRKSHVVDFHFKIFPSDNVAVGTLVHRHETHDVCFQSVDNCGVLGTAVPD